MILQIESSLYTDLVRLASELRKCRSSLKLKWSTIFFPVLFFIIVLNGNDTLKKSKFRIRYIFSLVIVTQTSFNAKNGLTPEIHISRRFMILVGPLDWCLIPVQISHSYQYISQADSSNSSVRLKALAKREMFW